MKHVALTVTLILALAGVCQAGAGDEHQSGPSVVAPHGVTLAQSISTPTPAAQSKGDDPVLIGAGDIADCSGLEGAEATAKLLEANPGTVMAIGDLAYPDGSKENFTCYEKTWGRGKSRTKP